MRAVSKRAVGVFGTALLLLFGALSAFLAPPPPRSAAGHQRQRGRLFTTPLGKSRGGGDDDGEGAHEGSIDWDESWRRKREELEEEASRRQARAERTEQIEAFSKRKEIIVEKGEDETYSYREIDYRGREDGAAGFLFEDNTSSRRSSSLEDEYFAASIGQNQLQGFFVLGIGGLVATFAFYVYVFLSGGISDGATRFEGMDMPTYGTVILPPTPPTAE